MRSKQQLQNLLSRTILRAAVLALTVVAAPSARAQTFTVLHTFTHGQDGANPYAGLTMDRAGNLYGTTFDGGYNGCLGEYVGCGGVFELKHTGSGWVLNSLYNFQGRFDGANPRARVIIGPNGSLYGTTVSGGGTSDKCSYGCGTVFNLRPQPSACKTALCPWTETVLYSFQAGTDGWAPGQGDVVFDEAGNIYDTTEEGGGPGCDGTGCGTVYELLPTNGGWTESVLYSFTGENDGGYPFSGVIFDQAGNLYGTTEGMGGYNEGTAFQLTPSGSSWAENILYAFQIGSDGNPTGGLIFDQSGNLYGTTGWGGLGNGGTVYELSPTNGSWKQTVLYSFNQSGNSYPPGSLAVLAMDAAGNLYGTTYGDGTYGYGSVFKLTPDPNGGWTYSDLHDFTGGSDGGQPYSNVILDANGDLYGTASSGGTGCYPSGCGVVWEITP